jgi:hypothetical protein
VVLEEGGAGGRWCWGRVEKMRWTDRPKNEKLLHDQGGKGNPKYNKTKKGRLLGLVTSCLEMYFDALFTDGKTWKKM